MAAIRCPACRALTKSTNPTCKSCGETLPAPRAASAPATATRAEATRAPRPCPDCAEPTANARCEHCGYKFRPARPCHECGEVTERQVCEFCGYHPRAEAQERGRAQAAEGAARDAVEGLAALGGIGAIVAAEAFLPPSKTVSSYFANRKRR